jgi:hypothetical protein
LTRADAQINLNKGWKIVVEFNHTDNLTSNTVSNAVAAVIGRYTNVLYAIEAYCEPLDDAQGITNYSRFFNQARGAIDNSGWKGIVRLAGPSRCNSEIDTFMGLITNLIGGVANIDLIDAHDYYAVPGLGSIPAPGDMSYIHPVSTNAQGHTLADRLGEMNHWQALTGHTNDRPVMSENGLCDSDVQDAIDAARAFRTNNVAVTLWAPNIPVHSALPIGHQLPGPLWDKPITEFMRELCQ